MNTIHFYPFDCIVNDSAYWPDEVKMTLIGTRTKAFNEKHIEIVLHLEFSALPWFIKYLMKPYKKALVAMGNVQTEIEKEWTR